MLLLVCFSCGEKPAEQKAVQKRAKVGMVLNAGSENDKSFFEYTMKGARDAAEKHDLLFFYMTSQSSLEYERHIVHLIENGADLIITLGFEMGDATARVARRYKNVHFTIVDVAYFPGFGCSENVQDCYSREGGLDNVTSLVFAEDQVGFLAGTLAACMSENGVIASVAGKEIPPVVRFVEGFQNGARWVNPNTRTLNQYLPSFDDPELGKVKAQSFIQNGADVVFGVGGNTGNGALIAAMEAEIPAIGVDGDQYYTFPEVAPALMSSASKKVDKAVSDMVTAFAQGNLEAGVRVNDLKSGGVDLAPFHEWEDRVPDTCRDKIAQAKQYLKEDPSRTGAVRNQNM